MKRSIRIILLVLLVLSTMVFVSGCNLFTSSTTTQTTKSKTTVTTAVTVPTTSTKEVIETTTQTSTIETTSTPTTETPKITISFDTNGGNHLESIVVQVDESIRLDEPVKIGYSFLGWYEDSHFDSDKITFTSSLTESVTLHAKWEQDIYDLAIKYYQPADQAKTFIQTESQDNSTMYLTSDHHVFVSGKNSSHQFTYLGLEPLNTLVDITEAYPLEDDEFIIKIELGDTFSLALTNFGNLYAIGRSYDYQYGMDASEKEPVLVNDCINFHEDETIADVFAVPNETFIVTSEQRIFATGRNSYGQLGTAFVKEFKRPVEITSKFDLSPDDTVKKIGCGKSYYGDYYLLTENGRLFTWLSKVYFEFDQMHAGDLRIFEVTDYLNLSDNEIVIDAVVNETYIVSITNFGRIMFWGNPTLLGFDLDFYYTPFDISSRLDLAENETFIKIETIDDSLYAFTSLHRLLFFGQRSDLSNLSMTTTETKFVGLDLTMFFDLEENDYPIDISGELDYKVITSANGKLLAWGSNDDGQIGCLENDSFFYPRNITDYFAFSEDETVLDVATSEFVSLLITSEKQVYAWGNNVNGGLGLQDSLIAYTPTNITHLFSFAADEYPISIAANNNQNVLITSLGNIYAWGKDYQATTPDEINQIYPPTNITNTMPLAENDIMISCKATESNIILFSEKGTAYLVGSLTETPIDLHQALAEALQDETTINDVFDFKNFTVFLTSNNHLLAINNEDIQHFNDLQKEDLYDASKWITLRESETILQIKRSNKTIYILTSDKSIYKIVTDVSNDKPIEERFIKTFYYYLDATYFDVEAYMIDYIPIWGFAIDKDNQLLYLDYSGLRLYEDISSKIFVSNPLNILDEITYHTDSVVKQVVFTNNNMLILTTKNNIYTLGQRVNGLIGNNDVVTPKRPLIACESNIELTYGETLPETIDGKSVTYYKDNEFVVPYGDVFLKDDDASIYAILVVEEDNN